MNDIDLQIEQIESARQELKKHFGEHYELSALTHTIPLLEELKKLRELKDTYAKGMEASYSEFRYKQGIAERYSKAENDYFAQSQKDREDTYNCGYAIGRVDAIEELSIKCITHIQEAKPLTIEEIIHIIRFNADQMKGE